MVLIKRHVSPEGLDVRAISKLDSPVLGYPAQSASNNIKTTANPGTGTLAAGTQPDMARNLYYQMSAASSAVVTGGSLVVKGLDIQGQARTETIALTKLAATVTNGVEGSCCFEQIQTIQVSSPSYLTATSISAQSSAISYYLGQHLRLGLPVFIKQADYTLSWNTINSAGAQTTSSASVTGVVNRVSVGNGTLQTTARGTQVTVYTGDGSAAVKIASGVAVLASNKPVKVHYWLNS